MMISEPALSGLHGGATAPAAAFMQQLARAFAAEPAYRHVGLQLQAITPGRCTATVPIVPALLHHRGAVQGGIVAMVADATAGYAALSVLDPLAAPDQDDMATLEFKTSFLLPAAGDTLRCTAWIIRHSRSIAFCMAEVFACTGHEELLCATASLTFKRLRAKRD